MLISRPVMAASPADSSVCAKSHGSTPSFSASAVTCEGCSMSLGGYILLADDNATDAELTIRALEIGGVGEQVVWVQDGEAALHFVFRKGVYAQRAPGNPCVMLL